MPLNLIAKIKEFFFFNKSLSQTIAKNTFWLFFGQAVGKILRATLIIYAARILGPSNWGAFSYVLGLIAFLLIFSDAGMSAIVTRESSKNNDLSKKYFATTFTVKIIMLCASIIILIFGVPYLTNIKEINGLLIIAGLLLIFDSLRNFSFSITRATEKMQWEAISEIITNILITGFGLYFLLTGYGVRSLMLAYVIGTAVGFILLLPQIGNYFKNIKSNFDIKLIKPLLSASLPFALASFLGAIMINTDLIMLGWMRTSTELGFYSAAQKPIQMLYVVAGLFATALFPVLTKASLNKEKFKRILEKALSISLLFAFPLTIGGIILGGDLINLFFGNIYNPATIPFQILCLTLLIIFPSVIISNSTLAINKQKNFVAFSLIGALGNILFNFLLIPIWGITGSAISTLITQVIANSFIWIKMKQLSDFHLFSRIKKILTTNIIVIFIILILKNINLSPLLIIAITTIIYFILLQIQNEPLIKNIFLRTNSET